jgi:DNA-directed RNA polymerase subunit RPC12/RpoP
VSGPAREPAAPAAAERAGGEPDDAAAVRCTWCGSEEVEQVAEWGPQLLASQYMCQRCLSPFEWIKRR